MENTPKLQKLFGSARTFRKQKEIREAQVLCKGGDFIC
jgi:hypothetical protein